MTFIDSISSACSPFSAVVPYHQSLFSFSIKMKLLNLAITLAVFISGASACKCIERTNTSNNIVRRTQDCCNKISGDFATDDCRASSISEHLRDFRNCCEGVENQGQSLVTSDCNF